MRKALVIALAIAAVLVAGAAGVWWWTTRAPTLVAYEPEYDTADVERNSEIGARFAARGIPDAWVDAKDERVVVRYADPGLLPSDDLQMHALRDAFAVVPNATDAYIAIYDGGAVSDAWHVEGDAWRTYVQGGESDLTTFLATVERSG